MIDASILLYPIYGGVLMRSKRIPAEKQYRLIMECRQSGLTDHQWCVEHNIKPGTFYNWVKKAASERLCGFASVNWTQLSCTGKPGSCQSGFS